MFPPSRMIEVHCSNNQFSSAERCDDATMNASGVAADRTTSCNVSCSAFVTSTHIPVVTLWFLKNQEDGTARLDTLGSQVAQHSKPWACCLFIPLLVGLIHIAALESLKYKEDQTSRPRKTSSGFFESSVMVSTFAMIGLLKKRLMLMKAASNDW